MFRFPLCRRLNCSRLNQENPPCDGPKNSLVSFSGSGGLGDTISTQKTPDKVCEFSVVGDCVKGDKCGFLHSWFRGDGFLMMAKLDGHKKAWKIESSAVANKMLLAGAQVWDLETLQPVTTLEGHTNDVILSLLCFDQYLLSCSLDQTIKVQVATEGGNMEIAYTHNEEHELVNLTQNCLFQGVSTAGDE